MNKKIRLFLIIICLPFLIGAKKSAPFQITGVKGKLLTNIQSRLNELETNKPIASKTDDELRANIEKAMYPYGYFKPSISIVRQDDNNLNITIHQGPRLLIGKFSATIMGEGRANEEINSALKNLSIREGEPFISVTYEEAKQSLLNAAEHQGYLHAFFEKAEILIDKENYTSSIVLVFNTGTQYFFGQIRFDPTYISPELLRRYVPFQFGHPYSTDQILALSDSLSGSGYFKSVAVKPADNGEQSIPIDVHLEPAARVNYSLGLGYGTDTGIRGRAGMHVVPVNRWGHKFNAVALGSFKENSIQTQYIIPGMKPLVDQYEVNSSLTNLHYDAGYSNSLLLSFAKRHNLPNFQRVLSINNLYERFNYSYQPKEEKFSFFPKATFTWLNKSDQLFSPNGYTITVNGFIANRSLLSALNFAQTSIDAKAALTLEKLRTRLYFHSMYGITQIKDINQFPLSLALLLGGSTDLKGYDYKSIGPGKMLTYGGFELQKETKKNWYLIGFLDAGDVYDPDVKSLKKDVGIGIMWVSPLGPIKIELAQRVETNFDHFSHNNPKLVINMGPDL